MMLAPLRAVTRRLGLEVWQLLMRPLRRDAATPPTGIEMRTVSAEEMALWDESELAVTPTKAAQAFARGDLCVGAFDGTRLIGYAWFASRPAPHVDGLWMAFDSNAVYIYRALVRPEYRGRGIAPALYHFADRRFLEQGKGYAIICVNIYNRPSIAAAQRSGASTAGYTAYWTAGGRFLTVRSPGAKRCGFRFYRP